jgi:hypothetical protein
METLEALWKSALEQMFWRVCAGWYHGIQGRGAQLRVGAETVTVRVEESYVRSFWPVAVV